MEFADALRIGWWPAIVIVGPALAAVFGTRPDPRARRPYFTRLLLPSGLVVVLALTPLSVAGTVWDQVLLGAAYVACCFAAQALFHEWRDWRRGAAMVTLTLVGLLPALAAALAAAWYGPGRTIETGCGLEARAYNSSSFSTEFVNILVFRSLGFLEYQVGADRPAMSERSVRIDWVDKSDGCSFKLRDEYGNTWKWEG